jgi:hypothetical protein
VVGAGQEDLSIIDSQRDVRSLPVGLRRLFVEMLRELENVREIISVSTGDPVILFEFLDKTVALPYFSTEIQEKIVHVLALYKYFRNPTYTHLPGALGADQFCSICGGLLYSAVNQCKNLNCQSRQYRKEIYEEV